MLSIAYIIYGAGIANISGPPEFTPVFSGVRVARSLVLFVMFCRLVFVLFFRFLLAIVLSALRFTASSCYSFGIFNFSYLIYKEVIRKIKLFTPWINKHFSLFSRSTSEVTSSRNVVVGSTNEVVEICCGQFDECVSEASNI